MGWDTQINIIVECIVNEEIEIAKELFNRDANAYYHNGISFIKFREFDNNMKVLFYTYERRKYLPYWTIREVSKKFNDKYFTVIGSCPDFIGGPAGLVKIVNGEIVDSYGFVERFGSVKETRKRLNEPDPELLFQCFGRNKIEESTRELYIKSQPRKWVDEKYADNILDFNDEEKEEYIKTINAAINRPVRWAEIKHPETPVWE